MLKIGKGSSFDQFNEPRHIDFDNKGNLYVSDSRNHRIQMFALIENKPCSPTSTGSFYSLHEQYFKFACL